VKAEVEAVSGGVAVGRRVALAEGGPLVCWVPLFGVGPPGCATACSQAVFSQRRRSAARVAGHSGLPLRSPQRSFPHEPFESGLIQMAAIQQVRSSGDNIRFSRRFLISIRGHQ
jgi:hypothetical protein